MKSQIKEAKTAWAMLTPALVVLALIQGYPMDAWNKGYSLYYIREKI